MVNTYSTYSKRPSESHVFHVFRPEYVEYAWNTRICIPKRGRIHVEYTYSKPFATYSPSRDGCVEGMERAAGYTGSGLRHWHSARATTSLVVRSPYNAAHRGTSGAMFARLQTSEVLRAHRSELGGRIGLGQTFFSDRRRFPETLS